MNADTITSFECVTPPSIIAHQGSGTALAHPVRHRTVCIGDVEVYKDVRVLEAEIGDDTLNRYFFAVLEGRGERVMGICSGEAKQATEYRSQ